MRELVLASASPRRQQLLEQIGISYRVRPSRVDETVTSSIPSHVVEELSARKCADVLEKEPEETIVLGADTVVAYEGQILGKPKDKEEAFRMLQMLQGRTHQVFTGVTLMEKKAGKTLRETFHVCTDVTFYPVNDQEIEEYIATGEPMDKAGAYGIQGTFCSVCQRNPRRLQQCGGTAGGRSLSSAENLRKGRRSDRMEDPSGQRRRSESNC